MPGDFDIAWNPAGVDRERSDPIVLEPDEHLAGIEAKYGGDVFVISAYNWVEIFSWVRDTPKRKGMLRLNPEEVQ